MMFPRAALLAAFALVAAAGTAQANLFTNGSLTGPTNTFSLVPPGWSNLVQGTTDTVSTSGHPFAGLGNIAALPFPASSDGGTFCWSGDFRDPNPALPEGLRQTVPGLTAGATYTIAFEHTNLGLYGAQGAILTNAFNVQNYASNGRWLVSVGGVEVGASDVVAFAPQANTQVWSKYAVGFVASTSSLEIAFAADWVSGNGTHVGMGIDGIRLTLVPAPSVVGVVALAGMTGLGRRTREETARCRDKPATPADDAPGAAREPCADDRRPS